jgi:hypothetical protein
MMSTLKTESGVMWKLKYRIAGMRIAARTRIMIAILSVINFSNIFISHQFPLLQHELLILPEEYINYLYLLTFFWLMRIFTDLPPQLHISPPPITFRPETKGLPLTRQPPTRLRYQTSSKQPFFPFPHTPAHKSGVSPTNRVY